MKKLNFENYFEIVVEERYQDGGVRNTLIITMKPFDVKSLTNEELVELSIMKYQRMLEEAVQHGDSILLTTFPSGETCPLCKAYSVFYGMSPCAGCPISQYMGVNGCLGTPWEKFSSVFGRGSLQEYKKAILEEIVFLKHIKKVACGVE